MSLSLSIFEKEILMSNVWTVAGNMHVKSEVCSFDRFFLELLAFRFQTCRIDLSSAHRLTDIR